MPNTPQRTLWNGPIKCGDLFTLQKTRGTRTHVAVCALFTHQFGWELRLMIGEELQRSQVCRSIAEWTDAWPAWKAAMVKKGWA